MPNAALVAQFNQFDDDKLQKLLTIGSSILSPLDTELTAADFASMMEQVFKPGGLADTYFPEWTDRSKGDMGRFLTEILGVFSDKDFFYINHFSKESFAGVAELYRSIFHKALNGGFNPPSNISARGIVDILFSPGPDEFVPRGTITMGVQDAPDLVYINAASTIPAASTDSSFPIPFIHGKLRRDQQFFDGYSIVIDTPKVVSDSVELTVGGVVWTEVASFLTGNNATKHYMVVYGEDGRAEILFAKGGLGAIPALGQICILEYITGGGYIGDIGTGTINMVINSQTTRNIISYTQQTMAGGNDLMPLELLRQTVISKKRHLNRVVSPEDARAIVKELSFVLQVEAKAILNYTYVYVLPISGGVLSPSQKLLVENRLRDVLLMGYNLTVTGAVFVKVTIGINIYLYPGTYRAGALVVAKQTIDEYLNPEKSGRFGKGVNRQDLYNLLMSRIRGAENITYSILYRGNTPAAPTDISFLAEEIVDVANSVININLVGGV